MAHPEYRFTASTLIDDALQQWVASAQQSP